MVRKSRKSINVSIPADTVEANSSLHRLGEINRMVTFIETEFAEEVARLRRLADERLVPLVLEHKNVSQGVELFAEQNWEALLPDDKKTVKLAAGSFGWRWTPTKVSIPRNGEEKIIARIKELELEGYIRVEESLDKEALLRDRPVITGVRYTQVEKFFIDPQPMVGDEQAATNVVRLAQAA